MRFKIDENLHPETVALLARAGHDVATVFEQGMRGHADHEIAQACRAENRVLITLDKDFGDIRSYPPHEYPGIVVLRLMMQNRANVKAVFQQMERWLGEYPLAGHLWVVDECEIRIRGNDA